MSTGDNDSKHGQKAAGFTARGLFDEAMQPGQRQSQTIDVGAQGIAIANFSIKGVSRIRRGFLSELLAPAFEAKTVKEAVDEAREAAGKLKALGIAKNVVVKLDQSSAHPTAVDVHFDCEDGSRYIVKTGVDVGDDEGMANVTGRLNNIWGAGESFEANYSRGSKTQAAFQGVLRVPVHADPQQRFEISAHQVSLDNRPYCSHDELRRTLGAAYRLGGSFGSHEVMYSASWRNICNLGEKASPSLRSEAGHSLKSSVAYTFIHDSRDSHTVPTCGNLLKIATELAGLGGDVQFSKSHVEVQANQGLGGGYVLSASAQGGLLWNLANRDISPRSPLADRFFLGGNASVRGFEYRGIGPRDHSDSLGGDVFYAAGVSLLTPLPFVRTDALRGHIWANAGQNALLDTRGLLRESRSSAGSLSPAAALGQELKRFLTSPSASVGVGLVYRHSIVRVELSCCLPLVAALSDRPKAGLQFGLGLQFL
ncbi:hypothetical protein GGI12_002442 [Dipsacomyces acuminosporus]|nr:hypothetical protein GGI12_002442 [Dipsacomyces acuminosporus]